MLLALLATVNLYAPPAAHHDNTPWDVLIVAAISIGFVLVIAGMASVGRRPPERQD